MSRSLLAIAVIAAISCSGSSKSGGRGGLKDRPGPGGLIGRPAEAGDPVPPGLRLPAGFKPTRYRARLAVDPAQTTFTGTIEIDGELAKKTSLLWLHAHELTFDRAIATAGGGEIALDPILHKDVVGLRAARELPAGPITIALDYRGTFQTIDSLSLIHI